MDRVKRQPASGTTTALSALAALVVYVLSTGPAMVLLEKRGYRPQDERMIEVVYAPLIYLAEHDSRIGDAFYAYFRFCGLKK